MGPYHALLLVLAGTMLAGVGVHAVAALRGARRVERAVLAFSCLFQGIYLFAFAANQCAPDLATWTLTWQVAALGARCFLVAHVTYLAVSTGMRVIPVVLIAGAGAVLLSVVGVSGPGMPWLSRVDHLEVTTLSWGEYVVEPHGDPSRWSALSLVLWGSIAWLGIWRGIVSQRQAPLVGAWSLILSHAVILPVLLHDVLLFAGLAHGFGLTPAIPPALALALWWRLAVLDRMDVDASRDLFHYAADAILVHDADSGMVVEANASAAQMFRAPLSDLIGRPLQTLIADDDPLNLDLLRQRVRSLRSEGPTILERRLRRADGEAFVGEVALSLAVLEGQERIIATYKDLTERRRTERALLENERRLRSFVARAPLPILTFEANGCPLAANPAFATVFAPQRATDAPAADLLADARWQQLLARAVPVADQRTSLPADIPDEHGRLRHVEVSWAITPSRVVLFLTDLTEVMAARDEIARKEQFYRILVEAATDGIAVLASMPREDLPRPILWNSRMAALTGIAMASAQQQASSWLAAIDDGAARARLRVALASTHAAEPFHEELTLIAGGISRSCTLSLTRLSLGDAAHPRLLLRVRDLTPMRQAEEERRRSAAQLRHAQKLESLAILAGGVAHDFNNILMTILGRAGVAAMRPGTAQGAAHHLLDMQQAAKRAAELCQQLLAYAGKGSTRTSTVDLAFLTQELVRMLRISAPRVRFQCDLPERIPMLLGDENQIRQVIMNVITNACEAIGDADGTVAIRLRRQLLPASQPVEPNGNLQPGTYLVLEVTDTGCGMDASTRRRMFEPFFTTKPQGRGLGMAATAGILRRHQGGLQVVTAPGAGTTMRLLLPAATNAQPETTPSRAHPRPPPPGTRVLVVDDEDMVRRATAELLRMLGCDASEAGSGLEALAMLGKDRGIRIVVLDLTMPELDGAETFRRIRALDDGIHVILASGYSREEVARSFGSSGVAAVLQKPYDAEALAHALQAALTLQRT